MPDHTLRGSITSAVSTNTIVLLTAFGIGSLLVFFAGGNPAVAFIGMFQGVTTAYGLTSTIALTSVLLLTTLSAVLAFTCNVWNIGAEGQLYMGAIGTTFVGLSNVLAEFRLPTALLVGFLFGGVWGLIPGVLKARLRVDEVVSTILMNYVAVLVVDYLVTGPLKDPTQAYNQSPLIGSESRLPLLIPGTKLDVAILAALGMAALVFALIFRTRLGYEIRLIGGNVRAAEYVGVRTTRVMSIVMFLSGGLAGLAGSVLITGISHRLLVGISNFYGYTGIAGAWLASLNPLAAIPSSFLFALLDVGGDFMQRTTGISDTLVPVITGVIIITVLLKPYLSFGRSGS